MSIRAIELVRKDCLEVLQGRAELLRPLKGELLTVTGGTGFVGTWLTELITCLNDEYKFGTQLVLVAREIDHFKKTRPHLANRSDIRFVKSDVRYTVDVPKETNWLIHAAANPNSRFHSTYPVETMTMIADGTAAILRAVDRCSAFKMFMNISSGSVYGAQPMNLERIPESYVAGAGPAYNTVSAGYAEAKRYGELLCSSFRSQTRLPVTTVRPFAFIGPYQGLETPWAVNNFIHDSMNGRAIRILGDGQTVRSYMYPSDMAFWLLRILTAAETGSCYNVGNPTGMALGDLASQVAAQFSPRPEVMFSVEPSAAAPSRLVPDVSLAEKKLGLNITVPLEQALQRTIQWNRLLHS